ncbi:MAG: hypothetical protein R3261_01305 [Alphaproteobacteria bacterium]|nr:hypothetical protein [Alphaproteobacteria bacterium]
MKLKAFIEHVLATPELQYLNRQKMLVGQKEIGKAVKKISRKLMKRDVIYWDPKIYIPPWALVSLRQIVLWKLLSDHSRENILDRQHHSALAQYEIASKQAEYSLLAQQQIREDKLAVFESY